MDIRWIKISTGLVLSLVLVKCKIKLSAYFNVFNEL